MAAIRFVDVSKRFDDLEVLRGVSFSVAEGSVHFVLGRSGAGKSVLVRHLVGLLRPDAGQVFVGDTEVSSLSEQELEPIRRRCQLIFQSSLLFDELSVLDNVALPLRKRFRLRQSEARRRARDVLDEVLDDADVRALAARPAGVLGPGVQKQVAIARALALAPEVMLYDEPTTSLDPVSARRTDRLISRTTRRLGLTSLVVSHDLVSVCAIADRVTFLHEGAVRFDGEPGALFASEDPVVRRLVSAGRSPRHERFSAGLTLRPDEREC